MKSMPILACCAVLLAALGTLLCVAALKPVSAMAFGMFAAWLLLPHGLVGAALLVWHRKLPAAPHGYLAAMLVSLGGMACLATGIFWRPDAQGGLAALMVPVYQGIALAFLLLLSAYMARRGT